MKHTLFVFFFFYVLIFASQARRNRKPVLHGKHWMAITGKPLATAAGVRIFMQGGNAVNADCAMPAASWCSFIILSFLPLLPDQKVEVLALIT
ncbi:MAG: hypothetical protein KFF73_01255 [Cyclobacteriaceae bacterium]|nr:hypothetical protein [Cyclobacteriaceae bacterium]